jgi:hypothetical protein
VSLRVFFGRWLLFRECLLNAPGEKKLMAEQKGSWLLKKLDTRATDFVTSSRDGVVTAQTFQLISATHRSHSHDVTIA